MKAQAVLQVSTERPRQLASEVTVGSYMDEAERRRQPTHMRYQTRVACENCHRQKLRCDTKRPCRRCIDSGREQFCCDRPHRKTGRPRTPTATKPSTSSPVPTTKPTSSSAPLKRRASASRHHEEMGFRMITADVAQAEMSAVSSKVAKKREKREERASRASSKAKIKPKFDDDNAATAAADSYTLMTTSSSQKKSRNVSSRR